MKDPVRLSAYDTTAFERRLLEGGKAERIPADMSARMGQVLNLGPAGVAGTAAASAKTGLALWVVGTATVAALIGGAIGHRWSPSPSPSETPPAATLVTTPPVRGPEAAAAVATVAAPPTTRREVAKVAAPDLRGEIGMVDAARAALAAGAPDRALAVLERYGRRYPRGTFAPEAATLRIEALVQIGDVAAARALGRQFLAGHPDSPLAERVEHLLAERR